EREIGRLAELHFLIEPFTIVASPRCGLLFEASVNPEADDWGSGVRLGRGRIAAFRRKSRYIRQGRQCTRAGASQDRHGQGRRRIGRHRQHSVATWTFQFLARQLVPGLQLLAACADEYDWHGFPPRTPKGSKTRPWAWRIIAQRMIATPVRPPIA